MLVALVGPDGAGKTTVARALERMSNARGKRFAYVHWVPNVWLGPPSTVAADSPPPPKRVEPDVIHWHYRCLSVVRLVRNLGRFWAGYLLGLTRHVHDLRGSAVLVVADRWIYNYVGQPSSVAYAGPASLARLAIRVAPRPDLTILLDLPAEVAFARKGELTIDLVTTELARWRSLTPGNPLVTVDATQSPEHIAATIFDHLDGR